MPDIDQIAELLQCTPGQAPERVRALVQGFPGNEPPSDTREVTIWTGFDFAQARYEHGRGWFGCLAPERLVYYRDVDRWWELPPVPEELE